MPSLVIKLFEVRQTRPGGNFKHSRKASDRIEQLKYPCFIMLAHRKYKVEIFVSNNHIKVPLSTWLESMYAWCHP